MNVLLYYWCCMIVTTDCMVLLYTSNDQQQSHEHVRSTDDSLKRVQLPWQGPVYNLPACPSELYTSRATYGLGNSVRCKDYWLLSVVVPCTTTTVSSFCRIENTQVRVHSFGNSNTWDVFDLAIYCHSIGDMQDVATLSTFPRISNSCESLCTLESIRIPYLGEEVGLSLDYPYYRTTVLLLCEVLLLVRYLNMTRKRWNRTSCAIHQINNTTTDWNFKI